MAKQKLTECKSCGAEIAVSAKKCPKCGSKNKKPFYKKAWFWIIVVILLIGMTGGDKDETPPEAPDVPVTETAAPKSETAPVTEAPTTEETQAAEPESTETAGQKNALRSAKSYLDFSAFSHDGLIDQLEYEQYSHEDAVYAADNCGADWSDQALKSAKNYLSYSAFSHDGLIQQLEYEKFSSEDARYAADNCGADWNEQAVKCAKNYLDFSAFSKQGLIDQLIYEGFTQEQAAYGVEQNGL